MGGAAQRPMRKGPVPASKFQQIFAKDDLSAEVRAGAFEPHLIGDAGVVRRNEVRQDELFDAGYVRHTAGLLYGGVVRQDASLQCSRIGDTCHEAIDRRYVQCLVDEDVSTLREPDQIVGRQRTAACHPR